MIIINNLEERWLQLYKQRTNMIVTRRQEDVKDQCMEYSTGDFHLYKKNENLVLGVFSESSSIC
jgi:hypothetical protein